MQTDACPDRDSLQAFSSGRLYTEVFDQIACHVVACESCQATLACFESADDSVMARLRQVNTPDPSAFDHSQVHKSDRYEIRDEIARGGMGVVYQATDRVLGREVAVKVLQERFAPTSIALQRFFDEARITGQLQHPGIPPVHDLGTLPDGRPFLAMKLVKGETLNELLKRRPDNTADRGRFIAVFEQICQAVAYAHAHGVIHRDLKPANFMVGAFGEVQVMDWGLAKVLSRTNNPQASQEEIAEVTEINPLRDSDGGLTQTGSVLGTPAYMPPEQAIGAVGKIDARSDVFGLGGNLAVILTGKPPFAAGSAESSRLRAAQGDVKECFYRLDTCGADPELVSLCKRCLAPAPSDRPADAGEVAKSVAQLRAAADERARRAELDLVKAGEQRKRRRVQLALAIAVGLMLVGAGIVAWWQDKQAGDRRAADLHRQIEEQRREADERARLGRNSDRLEELLSQCRAALIEGDAARASVPLLEANKREADGGVERHAPMLARCRAEFEMLRQLDQINDKRWGVVDVGRQFEISQVTKNPIDNLRSFGIPLASLRVAEDFPNAFASYGIVPGKTSNTEAVERINSSWIRNPLLSALDGWLIVMPSADLLAILQAADPDPFRNAFRAAISTREIGSVWVRSLASDTRALQQPPWFAVILGELPAITPERRAELLAAAIGGRPNDFRLLMTLAALSPIKTPETAREREKWIRAALAVQPNSVAGHSILGIAMHHLGRFEDAVREYKEAIRIEPKYSYAHKNLGLAYVDAKDYSRGEEAFRAAVECDPKNAETHVALGALYGQQRKVDDAIRCFKAAIAIDADLGLAHRNLGTALALKGDSSGALAAFREAVRVDPNDGEAQYSYGVMLKGKEDRAGAIRCFRQAVRLNKKFAPSALNNLGALLAKQNDWPGAINAFREASQLDSKDPTGHRNLAIALSETRDFAGAADAYGAVVRLLPKDPGLRMDLGYSYMMCGQLDLAITELTEAVRLAPKYTLARANLGVALCDNLDIPGAMAQFSEAIRQDPRDPTLRNALARILGAGPDGVRNGREAVEHAHRACELANWMNPFFIDTLAAAHAEAGDFEKAMEMQKKANSFAMFESRGGQMRLHYYERKRAYRDPLYVSAPRERGPQPREVPRN